MTDALKERDRELARLREEQRERSTSRLFAHLLDPGYLETLKFRGTGTASDGLTDAQRWAKERFETRLSRLKRAAVPFEDDERVGVACLLAEALDEPPLDDVHRDRIEAMRAIRLERAPLLPAFTETAPLRTVRSALRARKRRALDKAFLMLLGGVGVTKTSAGAHAIASVPDGVYVDAEILCGIWSSFGREEQDRVARLRTASVAVIGELKPGLIAERRLGDILSTLVEHRRGGNRITIMDGNMRPKDVARAFTPAAVSRLSGQVEWMWAKGEDLRAKRRSGG